MKSRCIFISIILFISLHGLGQSHLIDSLKSVLKTEKNDKNKLNILDHISYDFESIGGYDSSLYYSAIEEKLAGKIQDSAWLGSAYKNIGNAYCCIGNYPKALDNNFKALSIFKKSGSKQGITAVQVNIGNVYWSQGNYNGALEYYSNALTTDLEIADKNGIAADYENIGMVYADQLNYPKGLEFMFKALEIQKEIKNTDGEANVLGNIGTTYDEQGNYKEALEYELKSLRIYHEIGNKEGIAHNYSNIGCLLTEMKNYAEAKKYLDSAVRVSRAIGEKFDLKSTYHYLSNLDSATGDFKKSLEDYKYYIAYQDSLVNETNTKKTVQAGMNFEFEQKQAAEKAEQDKKDAIAEQDRKKQVVIRNSFIAGFALMLALAFFIFRGYRQKQRANEIITQQKEEVEKQKTLVEQQKALVEEKNKDILDSIIYAKRLQDAILPPMSIIKQYLPESFVFYKPKDIVAGDFYWMERVGDLILIAAADCTGHGVPGALVSVVCSNALNRTVKEFKITEPGKILDKVRELVLETFEKSEDNVQDGMDISLIAISQQLSANSFEIQWSGANNSLWYIQNNELKEVAPNKQPIGKYYNATAFNTHNLKLQKGDSLYLFTDGYADQFGGEKGKKFKYKQMQQLIMDNVQLTMEKQKTVLENKLNEWKGDLEQVDDVLVIGIRV